MNSANICPASAEPTPSPRALPHLMPLPTQKKSNNNYNYNRKKQKARTLYKMYKMKDYFFKWLQYYILFFDKKKEKYNPLVMEKGTIL